MKTAKYICLICLLIYKLNTATAQTWQWVKNGVNTQEANGGRVITENNRLIFSGFFDNTVTVGDSVLNGWSGPQTVNCFIAECSNEGVLGKITSISHSDLQSGFGTGTLVNANNNGFFAGGGMDGTVVFDTITFSSYYDGFLARYNNTFNALWVKKISNAVTSCVADNQNNTYVTGSIDFAVENIDTFTLYNSSPNPLFNPKMFLAKLDSTGKCLWVKQSWGGESGLKKVVSNNDNLYMCGYMDSCVTFDTVTRCGFSSFLMRTDRGGNAKWVSTYTYLKHAWFTSIDVDANSNCYVIGGFDSTMYLQNYTLTKAPNSLDNGFIAKYDSTGAIQWIKQFSSNALFHFDAIHTNAAGFTYAMGYFSQTGIFATDTITAQTSKDMFVLRVNPAGNYLGVKTVANVQGLDITEDISGNAIVTGDLKTGTTNFDAISLTTTGTSNFFLAKLSAITGPNSSPRMQEDNRLVIYPNPNSNAFTIVVPEGLVHSNTAHLCVYDNSGRAVKEEDTDISGNRVSTNLGTVQKGIYTVILSSGQKKFTGRVVVE